MEMETNVIHNKILIKIIFTNKSRKENHISLFSSKK